MTISIKNLEILKTLDKNQTAENICRELNVASNWVSKYGTELKLYYPKP